MTSFNSIAPLISSKFSEKIFSNIFGYLKSNEMKNFACACKVFNEVTQKIKNISEKKIERSVDIKTNLKSETNDKSNVNEVAAADCENIKTSKITNLTQLKTDNIASRILHLPVRDPDPDRTYGPTDKTTVKGKHKYTLYKKLER